MYFASNASVPHSESLPPNSDTAGSGTKTAAATIRAKT